MAEAEDTLTLLGPFEVTTAAKDVEDFAQAIGVTSAHGDVPLIYPVRMLMEEPVALALKSAMPPASAVLHQTQSFVAHSPLAVNQTYRLDVKLSRTRERHSKLMITGTITDSGNRLMQEFASTLVLLERP